MLDDAPRLCWRDEHGVVHRLEDDHLSERSPPYTLMMSCHAATRWLDGIPENGDREFSHAESAAIRAVKLDAPLTCLRCIRIDLDWRQALLLRHT